MKIYISCGLTHVPRKFFPEYVNFIHKLAFSLNEKETAHEVRYALVDSDPQLASKPVGERARLCYMWDKEMVEEADLVIVEASFPAIGVGIEMQIAEALDIPIIISFRDYGENKTPPITYVNPDDSYHELQIGEGYVSLIALGIPSVFKVIQYVDIEDGIRQINEVIRILEKND